MWPVVERAIEFVLELQTPRGEIIWARHADGTPWTFALLTGSSSISHSLRCAIAIAELLGHERPDWELSLGRLAHVIRTMPGEAFAPKNRWAMDWYYPVLAGVMTGDAAQDPARGAQADLHHAGQGRALRGRPTVGHRRRDLRVRAGLSRLSATARRRSSCSAPQQTLRDHHGHYFTGIVYPELVHFPDGERSTYTSAAVVLTADALAGATPAADLWSGSPSLPPIMLDIDDEGREIADQPR